MTIERLRQLVGEERWARTCVAAYQVAADPLYGHDREPTDADVDAGIPHDIADLVWEADLAMIDRIRLFAQVYTEMPCYGHLIYVRHNRDAMDDAARDLLWRLFSEWLSGRSLALRNPLAYTLWCDWFEDPETVSESWTRLTDNALSDEAIETLLVNSGPVPFAMKSSLYRCLFAHERWHYWIFRSLLHSAFDCFGRIDPEGARALLRSLRLPKDTAGLSGLMSKLDHWGA